MSFTRKFAQQSPAIIAAEMVILLLLIGLLDFITGYEVRLLPFYAAPIFVLAWFCGVRSGIFAAVLSGVVWGSVNWVGGDPGLSGWLGAWEIFRHFGSFLIVALVGSALRTRSDIAAERIALLERSQRLEQDVVNISDTEQRRIGQDLHDGLCQYLAGLTCCASSLREDLEKLQLQAEAGTAGELAKMLQDAVVQTRDLARRLVPAHINRLGLVLALELLAHSITRLHGVRCTFTSRGDTSGCDQDTAIHLYRIVQEAINNATRHGQAKNILISLDAVDHTMTLRISDDGVGIAESHPEGTGLTIMRYRARLVGGELMIGPRDGSGTILSCTARTNSQPHETAAA